MRKNLIKLFRKFEDLDQFENEYKEYFEQYDCEYSINEFLHFPNYRTIIAAYNNKYPIKKSSDSNVFIPNNSIRAEVNRMEADGLIMIGIQEGIKNAVTKSKQGPDFDDNAKFTCESIILTTKGKSAWRYLVYQIMDNPVTTILSFLAICISIVALFI